jgi:hypothetical protein
MVSMSLTDHLPARAAQDDPDELYDAFETWVG